MTQLSPTSIRDALQSAAPIDAIRVQGWVRTRRDSKDFSFIELNDGSSLRNLQIIAKKDALPNYADMQRLSTGASLIVSGALVASQGKGQRWELVAAEHRDRRRRRRHLSAAEEGTHAGVFARDRASASSLESCSAASFACEAGSRLPFTSFSRSAVSFTSTRRSSPEAIAKARASCFAFPRIDSDNPPRRKRRNRLLAGFFRPTNVSDRQRSTRGRGVRVRAIQGLHLWPDVPRGELQHVAARQRVLDDRAGNGVLRSYRQHGSRRRVREIPDRRRPRNSASKRWNCSRNSSIRNCLPDSILLSIGRFSGSPTRRQSTFSRRVTNDSSFRSTTD